MRYMLLIHEDEARFPKMSESEAGQLIAEYNKFTQDCKEAGAYLASDRLRPTTSSTTVRVRKGEAMITDGPFAETKEQLGGYYLIEAKDLDEAVKWAAKVPSAKTGSVEVRPIWE